MNELLSSKSRSKSLPIREILNNSIILFRSIDVEQSRANFPKLPPDTYHKEVLRNDTQKKHLSRAVYLTTRGGSTFFLASNIVPTTEGIIIRSIKGGRGQQERCKKNVKCRNRDCSTFVGTRSAAICTGTAIVAIRTDVDRWNDNPSNKRVFDNKVQYENSNEIA